MRTTACTPYTPYLLTILAALAAGPELARAATGPEAEVENRLLSPWLAGPGSGYRHGARQAGLTLGGAFGTRALGASQAHDFGLLTLRHSRVFSRLEAAEQWNAGNWELLLDAVLGRQTHPRPATFAGVVPVFRYSFATGTRWVPYLEVGLGLAYNEIRGGDLSSDLELLGTWGGGTRVYLDERRALVFGYRWLHLSNLGVTRPNHGVDAHSFQVGFVAAF